MSFTSIWFWWLRHRPQQARTLTTITLTGASGVVVTHGTAYTAVGKDQNGAVMAFTPTYRSSDATKATIDSSGGAIGVAAGSTNIDVISGAVTSNAIALTVSAQVATSPITVVPSSATTTVSGTQALTATVYDQVTPANVIAGASVSWGSGATGVATVNSSTGLVTGVAPGNATITATSGSATGTSAITVSGGGSVTSVSVFYNSQAAPFLAFTGTTYTLVAKDQDGNVLDGSVGSWASTDVSNAPINSSTGVVSPNALVTGATFTYTHTASGRTGTIAASVLKAPTWLKSDKAANHLTDGVFRGAIFSGVTTGFHTPPPTGPNPSLYMDGINEGYFTLDNTRQFMGEKTFLMTFNAGFSGTIGLGAPLPSTYTRVFGLQVYRYDPGFTPNGSGGGAASYKTGLSFNNSGQEGRTAVLYTNTTDIALGCVRQNGGSVVGGQAETLIGVETTEWADGGWYAIITLYEVLSSNTIMSSKAWAWKIGQHPITNNKLSTSAVAGPMTGGFTPMTMNYVWPFGENYNRTIPSNMYKSIGFWGACSGVSVNDPLGILGT